MRRSLIPKGRTFKYVYFSTEKFYANLFNMKKTHGIIFIPGFKGSLLYNQKGDLVWPNIWQAQFSKVQLHYHLPELGLINNHHYYSTDIVRSAPLIPHIFEFDVYGNFIKQLHKKFTDKVELVTFHYDWRDYLHNSVTKLNELILKLKAQGITKIDIISHSMGGLIASYLLRYGKDNTHQQEWALAPYLNKIFFVATPFKGAIKSLHEIIHGSKFGINRSLLSPQSICTFPSTYYLLPSYNNALSIVKENSLHESSLYDLNTWQKYELSFLNKPFANLEISDKRLSYLRHCLATGKEFQQRLHSEAKVSSGANTKLVLINSDAHDSLAKLEINEHSGQFNWHHAQGDGTIASYAIQTPSFFSSFQTQQYSVKAKHAKMFLAKEVQEICWQEISSSLDSD